MKFLVCEDYDPDVAGSVEVCQIEDKHAKLHGGVKNTWEEARDEAVENLIKAMEACRRSLKLLDKKTFEEYQNAKEGI